MDNILYEGKWYRSLMELCHKLKKSYNTVLYRLDKGMSLNQAIESPVISKHVGSDFETTDHLGNVYPSKRKMAAAYGKRYQTVARRLKMGWSLEDALTKDNTPLELRHCSLPSVDHTGRVFESPKEMCEFYNIPARVVSQRLSVGWSLEDALTRVYKPNKKRSIV